jgi:type III restriction enzyme
VRKPGAFKVEYQTEDGGIADYYPDFIVKETDADIWLIETKGREDLEGRHKWERLKQWCADATVKDGKRRFRAVFVQEEDWERYRPKTFQAFVSVFEEKPDK